MFGWMIRKRSLVIFLGVATGLARGDTSDFATGLGEWKAWGTGEQTHSAALGHAAPGSVMLQCGSGQEQTLHRALPLAPGRYRVTAWLRGDIGEGQWGFGGWIFYAVSEKHETVVRDLKGAFDWSRVTFTIEVPAGCENTHLWFRLKAPGSLWLDDIAVEPHTGEPIAYQFARSETAFPKPNAVGVGSRCVDCHRWWAAEAGHCLLCGAALAGADGAGGDAAEATPPERLLIGFEAARAAEEKKRHVIRRTTDAQATEGARAGVIAFGRYNNMSLGDPAMRDWSGYDYFAIDVFNPLTTVERFSIAISDKEAASYWDQLNHYTRLTPGWNRLRFHINRHVGERGSVKIKRYLDRRNIRRLWFAVAPEDPRPVEAGFLVDNVRLLKAPPAPVAVAGMHAFDFVQESSRVQGGFLPVLERHRYHPDVGFGFVDAAIWRSHDSVYADTLNRDGIFVLKGGFGIDLPAGRYVVYLCVNPLGYWNEHFWSRRWVAVEGRPVLDQTRTNAADRVADFLRFQDVEPEPGDNPYDLYLRDIFAPLVVETDVADGRLDLAFEADASGLCLNWLIVAPAAKRAEVDRYLADLRPVQQDEFDNLARAIEPSATVATNAIGASDRARGFYAALVDSDARVRPGDILPGNGPAIRLEGGVGERPLQALLVRNLGPAPAALRVTASALRSADGRTLLKPGPDWVRRAVNQYQCHSYNHETFEISPRFLRRLDSAGHRLPPARSLLLWYQLAVDATLPPGVYRGELTLRLGDAETVYPVELTVHPYTLPPLDTGVGFFGLDPVDLRHNPPPDAVAYRSELRHRALEELARRGFTTWTGLPPAQLVKNGDRWQVEAPEIDALMNRARQLGFDRLVFTYGGGLETILQLDARDDIAGLPQAEYRRVSAAALQVKLGDWLPISITFSDEAAGYSSAVERDLGRAAILKTHYPFLRRSGATGMHGLMGEANELNLAFTDLLLSSQTRAGVDLLREKGLKWGYYNVALGLFTYDRPAFGQGLYLMRRHGMEYLLNWALTFANNYPYYDLDGREQDAMMLFPRTDGELCAALKFEWAAQGVEDCRLLMLLEQRAKAAGPRGADALNWLNACFDGIDPFAEGATGGYFRLASEKSARECDALRAEVRRRILELPAAPKSK